MYQPPPGRPISSPPMGDTPAVFTQDERRQRRLRLTAEERAGILADYMSGMKISDIRAKYGYKGHGSIVRITKPIQNRNKPARPVRADGESKQRYAQRVQQWMRDTNPEYDAQIRANKSAGQKRYARKRRLAKERAERLAAMEAAAPPMPDFMPPPRPSLLRRMFWWLLP